MSANTARVPGCSSRTSARHRTRTGTRRLTPPTATNPVGTQHTVVAVVQDGGGNPVAGIPVTFTVISGPDADTKGTAVTDTTGWAMFTFSGSAPGTDIIVASIIDPAGTTITSDPALKNWEGQVPIPEFPGFLVLVAVFLGTAAIMYCLKKAIE